MTTCMLHVIASKFDRLSALFTLVLVIFFWSKYNNYFILALMTLTAQCMVALIKITAKLKVAHLFTSSSLDVRRMLPLGANIPDAADP